MNIKNLFYSILSYLEKFINLFLKNKNFSKDIRKNNLFYKNNIDSFYNFCRINNINYDVSSNHYKFFFNLKKKNFRPKKILEVGTFKGHTTFFLAKLFPDSVITTIDLPKDDPLFSTSNRQRIDPRKRGSLLHKDLNPIIKVKKIKNINEIKKNSCNLFNHKKVEYDLIWLDGSHSYPEISWDIFYGLQVLKKGGYLFVDDVFINKYYKVINWLEQIDTYKIIKYYNERNKLKFQFFTKRDNSSVLKFIAFYKNK